MSQSLLLVISVLLLRGTDSHHISQSCMTAMPAVSKVINSLGYRLEKLIDNQENYFLSPLSITMALAMVYIGARGTTREQMSDGLELNVVGKNCLPNKVSENFRELIHTLVSDGEDYSLLIANGAFVQTGKEISQYYASNLEKYFNSNVRFFDFADEEIATMEAINKWVANYTKNKIPKLLNEPLDHLTLMVLVNAVYFRGLWESPFDKKDTEDAIFYSANNEYKNVPFMKKQDTVHYYFDQETQYYFLELEYTGGNTSMIIVLPQNTRKIPTNVLTSDFLCALRYKFELRTVNIILPRFKMEFRRELSKDMMNLGMEELFSETADLSGIRERNDLHVSLMLHKAVIEVDEMGSEAAAISGVGIDGRLKVPQKETFKADHPFLFYIVHRDTDTILFSGRVMNP